MSHAHLTEFYLYFPREEQAGTASSRLGGMDYQATIESCSVSGRWLVLARKLVFLTAESLASARTELTRVAAETGGIYDGWATRLSRPDTATVSND